MAISKGGGTFLETLGVSPQEGLLKYPNLCNNEYLMLKNCSIQNQY